MNDTTNTQPSAESPAELIARLTAETVSALQLAKGETTALESAVREYVTKAQSAHLSLETIEDMLGVSEPCIMDLAELSEADEETVIDSFEALLNL